MTPRRSGVPVNPAFFLGLLATASQVILLRETVGRAPDQGLAVTLALAVWLLAGAAGASGKRRGGGSAPAPPPEGPRPSGPPTVPGVSPAILLPLLLSTAAAPYLLDLAAAACRARPLLPLPPAAFLAMLPVVALPAFLAGRAFAALAAAGGTRAYAAEAAGALAGGLLVTFGAAGRLGLTGQLLALGAILFAGMATERRTGAPPTTPPEGLRPSGPPRSYRVLALLCLALIPFAPALDRRLAEAGHPGYAVTGVADSREGRILALEREGATALLVNGALVAARPPAPETTESGLLLALLHGSAESALLAGPGAAGFADGLAAAMGNPPDLLAGDPALAAALVSAGVPARVVVASFEAHVEGMVGEPGGPEGPQPSGGVRGGAPPGGYDIVVLPCGAAESLAAARFAALEAVGRAKRALRPGGLLALSAGEAGPYLSDAAAARHGALAAALAARFAHVTVSPEPHAIWLASDDPARATSAVALLARRRLARGGDAPGSPWRPLTAHKLFSRFEPGRVAALLSAAEGALPASAKRPAAYRAGVARMCSHLFGVDPTGAARRAERALPALLLLFPMLLFLYARLAAGPGALALALALFGGAAAMGTELALLALFRSARGDAYGALGLLVGLFMGGLAIGARLSPGGRRRAAAVLAAGALPPAFLLLPVEAFGLPLTAALMAACGAATGALLPALLPFADPSGTAGGGPPLASLYAADLAGAALGAAAAGLVSIPFAGVDATASALAFGYAFGALMTFTLNPAG